MVGLTVLEESSFCDTLRRAFLSTLSYSILTVVSSTMTLAEPPSFFLRRLYVPVRSTSLPSIVWLVLAPKLVSLSFVSPLAFSSKPSEEEQEERMLVTVRRRYLTVGNFRLPFLLTHLLSTAKTLESRL